MANEAIKECLAKIRRCLPRAYLQIVESGPALEVVEHAISIDGTRLACEPGCEPECVRRLASGAPHLGGEAGQCHAGPWLYVALLALHFLR